MDNMFVWMTLKECKLDCDFGDSIVTAYIYSN